jgi:hypothetical protein
MRTAPPVDRKIDGGSIETYPFGAKRTQSIKVEPSIDRVVEDSLLTGEEHTDLLRESIGGNRGDVVATDDGRLREAVRRGEVYLTGARRQWW